MKRCWIVLACWVCAFSTCIGQTTSSSPDTQYTVTQGIFGNRACLIIEGPAIHGKAPVWISPYGLNNGLGSAQERIAKVIWAPAPSPAEKETLFALVTNRVRFKEVLQPDSLYVYSCESGQLVFFKRFGLRWSQHIEWSPDSSYIATIASAVGEKSKATEKVVIYDVYSGESIATLYDNAIPQVSSADIDAIHFISPSSMDISYKVNGSVQKYEWKFNAVP